jgi:elongation factor 1 alpha-like protein
MNAPATNSAKLASTNQQSLSQKSQNTKPFEKALPAFLQERQNNLPSQLSMVVLGHVDAGKSTLMGQLLIQTGQINKRQALRGGANLAWLLDENESERARGVTMEIGTKALTTKNHRIVVLDAPGHADFIPIMITGAANADTCILVVDAVTGEFESGFSGGGQTKEHILLAKGLGVSQVIVAVNKLDVEGWKEDRYQVVSQEVVDYLTRQKFKLARIQCVPVSGLTGENVEAQTEPLLRQWYSGPTLLQAMNRFKPANRQLGKYSGTIIQQL